MPVPYLIVIGAMAVAYFFLKDRENGAAPLALGPGAGPGVVPPSNGPGEVLGYNPAIATRLAPELAAEILEKGTRANKELIRAFQSATGVTVDGGYGPDTREALRFWLGIAGSPMVEPPDPVVARSKSGTPYVPPGEIPGVQRAEPSPTAIANDLLGRFQTVTGFNPQVAQNVALAVANVVGSYKKGYFDNPSFRNLVTLFQVSAGFTGRAVDGKYGPGTRGALVYYLNLAGLPGGDAPPSYFGRGTRPYRPPG